MAENESEKSGDCYARRAQLGQQSGDRYSMLNPSVWQGVQERPANHD